MVTVSMSTNEGKEIIYKIDMDPKPQNCKVCPFLRRHTDEFSKTLDCMFDVPSEFGRFVERPKLCPFNGIVGACYKKELTL